MASRTAVVLAGRRGPADPVAAGARTGHKALVPVAGEPMLLHVVRALRETPGVGRILVSIDDPAVLESAKELGALVDAGTLECRPSRESAPASVIDCLEAAGPEGPVLVTTADHPLLTAEMIGGFCAEAERSAADLVVGVVTESVVRARVPDAPRTWLPLRGERITGANLFLFRTARGARAAGFWQQAERHRKRPWRLAGAFGWTSLLLFGLGRLDLEAAFARASRAIGARVEAVRLPFAECAIDVDRPADLALVERIFAERKEV